MVAIEAFLSLEQSLTDRLAKHWSDQFRPLAPKLTKALEDRDWLEASAILKNIDFEGFVEKERGYVKTIATSAMLYGASRFINPKKTSVYRHKNGREIIEPAIDQFAKLIKQTGEEFKKSADAFIVRYRDLVEAQAPIQKAALPKNMANPRTITDTVMRSGKQSINVSSSLYNSRLSSYGFLVEATYTGVSTYEINEQMDSRTCPVCEAMHGESFEVTKTIIRLDRNLRIDDPDQLKTVAPWYPQNKEAIDELRRMSQAEMEANSLAAPPFHPLCRGVLVASDIQVDTATNTVYDQPEAPTVQSTFLQHVLVSSLVSNVFDQ